jgi:hypothetical protein
MIRIGLTVVLLLLCSWELSNADFMDVRFLTNCDDKKNRAEIVPYETYDSTYNATPQLPGDCTLSSGRTIRIKMEVKHPPPAGSIVALFEKDKAFCHRFQRIPEGSGGHGDMSWNVLPPKEAELLSGKISPYVSNGHYERFKVDINNDGKDETVIALYSRTHYRDGDIYFVYSGNPVPELTVEGGYAIPEGESFYAKTANRVLPYYCENPSATQPEQLINDD